MTSGLRRCPRCQLVFEGGFICPACRLDIRELEASDSEDEREQRPTGKFPIIRPK